MIARFIIVVLLLVVLLVVWRKGASGYTSGEIPKIIWTWWDGPNPPTSVTKCIQTWKVTNPDHDVIILGPKNIKQFLPEIDILNMKMATTPQRTADLVRVHVLAEHGGIWCDATIMLTGPLNFVHENRGYELIGYHIGAKAVSYTHLTLPTIYSV